MKLSILVVAPCGFLAVALPIIPYGETKLCPFRVRGRPSGAIVIA